MQKFIDKHQQDILGVLSGFDRIRFRGTIRMLAYVNGLFGWLCDRKVLLKNFTVFAQGVTATIKESVHSVAKAAGRSVQYLASSTLSKEVLVQELLRREGISDGLVCVLSCVEPRQSFDLHRNSETTHLDLVAAVRKCLHWYLYFLDAQLGLCHVRIQSWLPFSVHVCVNGREWLCRELQRAGIGFTRSDNCLTQVDDVAAAQKFLNAQPWADWTGLLNGLLQRACPALLQLPLAQRRHEYYWSADETEWATDVMFRSPEALQRVYPSLLLHAMLAFSSRDVMRFLGHTRMPARGGVDVRFNGEVVSDLRERPEGTRIRHSVNENSIKLYDKQGSVLRPECTINNTREFRVYRVRESDPDGPKSWQRLRKGVVDLPRRAEISHAACARYLTALAEVNSKIPLGEVADAIRRPVLREKRRYRGLQPLSGPDAELAAILLRGEFSLNGIRNRDIRERLHPDTTSATDQRRQSGQVSRLLRLFSEHALIRKLPGTHRYHLTAEGRRTLPAFIIARHASTEKLTQLAS